jgi:DNA-binding NarL/FixJ family response regulator
MKNDIISIALADDHSALRQAFKVVFNNTGYISVIFDVGSGRELLLNLKTQQPNVLLLDLKMPEINGIMALAEIYNNYPSVHVLMFSAYIDEVYVSQCMRYGINGFLSKSMDLSEIIYAIKAASRNELYFNNLLNIAYLKKYIFQYKKHIAQEMPAFTIEEINILELLKMEKSTKEISAELNISTRSVELKKDKMREKSNTKTISGLLIYSIRRGLID